MPPRHPPYRIGSSPAASPTNKSPPVNHPAPILAGYFLLERKEMTCRSYIMSHLGRPRHAVSVTVTRLADRQLLVHSMPRRLYPQMRHLISCALLGKSLASTHLVQLCNNLRRRCDQGYRCMRLSWSTRETMPNAAARRLHEWVAKTVKSRDGSDHAVDETARENLPREGEPLRRRVVIHPSHTWSSESGVIPMSTASSSTQMNRYQ